MKPRRKSEGGTRRKMKKYTRSCTEVLQRRNSVQNDTDFTKEFDVGNDSLAYGWNDGSKTDSEIEYNASIRFLDDAEEYVSSFNAKNAELRKAGYVPITRCCKKITFPPNYVEYGGINRCGSNVDGNQTGSSRKQNNHQKRKKVTMFSQDDPNEKQYVQSCLTEEERVREVRESNSGRSLEGIMRSENEDHVSSDKKSLPSSDSLNSSSLEKDSSDNDDELDPMIFDANLEEYGSEDLWNFLKTLNDDLSIHLKKAKRSKVKSLFGRSKSQECRIPEGRCSIEKSLARSRSKEEKNNCPNSAAISYSSQETCDSSSLSDINNTSSRELSHSLAQVTGDKLRSDAMAHLQENSSVDTNQQMESLKNPKKRYYSLSNLNDYHSFLYENKLYDKADGKSLQSLTAAQGLDDKRRPISGVEVDETSGDIHFRDFDQFSIYDCLKSNQTLKGKRSQSHVIVNKAENYGKHPKALSYIDLKKSGVVSNGAAKNKALSDLDISYWEKAYNTGSTNTVCSGNSKEQDLLRFAKSLESKLNLNPGILLEPSNKRPVAPSKNQKKCDSLLKKRSRKVSFIGDRSKEEHTNFALESIAKAQMALNNLDREFVSDKMDEDKGTLLEALKTQGYKNIMSQRLQQSEDEDEDEILNRRYLACLLKLKNCDTEEIPLDFLRARNFMDNMDFSKRVHWNRGWTCSLNDVSNDYNELEYSDLLNLNGIHLNTDTDCIQFRNAGLYQSIANFRPNNTVSDNISSLNWEEQDLGDWQACRNSERKYNSSSHNKFYDLKLNRSKKRENDAQNKDSLSEFDPRVDRNTESPIEKLSSKIKALKNRCHQKSFDESALSRSISMDSEANLCPPLTKRNENSANSEMLDLDKPEESVSDRIWRKSFYSRFNETPTLRRRRSMLFESDFSQSQLLLNPVKLRNACDSNELLLKSPETEKNPLLFKDKRLVSRSDRKMHDASEICSMSCESEQNIPNHINATPTEEDVVNSAAEGD